MSLQGQIEEMQLGAVIQTLSLNRYMGTLRIETEDAGNQFLFLSEGELVLVRQVQRDPVRLGDLLVRAGKLQSTQLEDALSEQKKRATGRLGSLLVELGMIQQDEIEKVIRGKFEEDVLDMFLLDRGRFEFIFGLSPEALFAPDEKLERVSLNAEGLMLEAMRRIDEWQEMFKALGSLDTIYQNRGSQSEAVGEMQSDGLDHLPPPARISLYGLLDGTRSLREVLAEAIRAKIATRRETFLFLYALYKGELVTPLDSKTLLTEARNALGAKDVPKAAKYIRAILGRKGELELSLTRRYLDFLKKNKRPKLAFDEARLFAAQCLTRGDTEQAIALYEEAAALEFCNAEVLDRLFYTLLRANRRDRAVQVGLALRDHLGSEAGATVATRVVRNLKELAPDDPEVLELSGLVHKQREENEEAVRELERALATIGQKHARRPLIVNALLELQPGREDLLAEKESSQVRAAREQMRREFRRRLLAVGVLPTSALLLLIVAWTGWGELRARTELDRARGLVGEPAQADLARLQEADSLLSGIESWTRGAELTALREQVATELQARRARELAERDELIRGRQESEAARAEELRRQERVKALEQDLQAYQKLVAAADWQGASQKALELRQSYPDLGETRLEVLKVFLQAQSEPEGAELYVDGRHAGVTPAVVGLVPGKHKVGLRLRGYRVLEEELEATGWGSRRWTLTAGPVWRVELEGTPLLPLACGRAGVVAAQSGGKLTKLSFVDGHPLWSPPTRDALEAIAEAGHPRPPALEWVIALQGSMVAGAGPILVAFDPATGQVQRVTKLPGRTRFLAPQVARLRGQELLVLVDEKTLSLVAPSTGQLLQEVLLPAQPTHPPVIGGGRAFLPLRGDLLVAVDLQERTGATLIQWRQSGVPAAASPLWSERAETLIVRDQQELRAIRGVDGQLLATLRPDLGPLRDVAVVDERVYVLSEGGLLAGLGVYDGELVVPGTKVADRLAHGPLAVGKDVLLVDAAGEVIRVSLSGRRRGGKLELGGPASAVQAAGDRLLAIVDKSLVLLEPAEE